MDASDLQAARRATLKRLLAAGLGLALATFWAAPALGEAQQPKNVIIMFADGAAATQWDFGRYSSQALRQKSFITTDVVFKEGSLGLASTYSSDAYVTDSAAAGSAMSTGHKVKNGAVAVTPDGKAVRTVMEAARANGKRIGLVTTARVYDATPTAFSIHAASRAESQALVDQYLVLEPDVLMGGGADYFLPAGVPGGSRNDGRDLIAAFRGKGYEVVRNTAELAAASGPRLLGLFAAGDMDFELDRDPVREPTTEEMTAAALKLLERTSPNGFVLLVENENIDTAGHSNDAASLMRALWAFDDAVGVALEFQRRFPETLLIVTGDHETGGFSPTSIPRDAGSQLLMLERISMSFAKAAERLGARPSAEVLDRLLGEHFPGFRLDADLRELILERKAVRRNFAHTARNALGRMVARQTGFYWGTSGHTSEPVVVGALGPGAELFRGYQDNTDFGKHLHRLLRAGEP